MLEIGAPSVWNASVVNILGFTEFLRSLMRRKRPKIVRITIWRAVNLDGNLAAMAEKPQIGHLAAGRKSGVKRSVTRAFQCRIHTVPLVAMCIIWEVRVDGTEVKLVRNSLRN
jgi:hypothetical protein